MQRWSCAKVDKAHSSSASTGIIGASLISARASKAAEESAVSSGKEGVETELAAVLECLEKIEDEYVKSKTKEAVGWTGQIPSSPETELAAVLESFRMSSSRRLRTSALASLASLRRVPFPPGAGREAQDQGLLRLSSLQFWSTLRISSSR